MLNKVVYYQSSDVIIRNMVDTDPQIICIEEKKQGWLAVTTEKYLKRLSDQSTGRSIALIAEYKGNVAGYINIYDHSGDDNNSQKCYCQIIDFGVFEKYLDLRNYGIDEPD